MSTNEKPLQQPLEDEAEDPIELEAPIRRRHVDPDEREEYEEWRRERGGRGRKRRRSRDNDHSRREIDDL